jgi:putative endonuclease
LTERCPLHRDHQRPSFKVGEHREGLGSRFAARYGLDRLVYYEIFKDPYNAMAREKQLKAGPRRKKVALIEKMNREWRDLSGELCGWGFEGNRMPSRDCFGRFAASQWTLHTGSCSLDPER